MGVPSRSMAVPWDFQGTVVPWQCHGIAMAIYNSPIAAWEFHSTVVPCQCLGIVMAIDDIPIAAWEFHSSTMAVPWIVMAVPLQCRASQ